MESDGNQGTGHRELRYIQAKQHEAIGQKEAGTHVEMELFQADGGGVLLLLVK